MKKFLTIIFLLFLTLPVQAEDYRALYQKLPMADFSYLHGVDPKHFFENKDASYSVYPLLRLSTPLYFKSVTIPDGFYDLTPREHKGQLYMLFKQNGLVRYIVPIYKKDLVPPNFYETHIPKEKVPLTKKIGDAFYRFIGKHFKRAKRHAAVKTYLEVNDVGDNFIVFVVYYDAYRYYILLRSVKM